MRFYTRKSETISIIILCIGLSILLVGLVSLALTPPYSRDALIHHLAVPKLWIKKGIFCEIPGAVFSYYPMNVELLYFLCLLIGSDILPKVIHLCFGLGTGLIIYFYVKPKLGKGYAILGLLLWFSTPIVIYVGPIAYIDLGLTFFIMGALFFLLYLMEERVNSFISLILFSLFTGLALGTKYTAFIILPFFTGVLFIVIVRRYGNVKALKYTAIFLILSLFIASPWYIKNLYLTGNPLYPFSTPLKVCNTQREKSESLGNLPKGLHKERDFHSTQIGVGRTSLLMRRVLYKENMLQILSIPLRIFWQGKDNDPQFFDGVLNPIFLIFLPFFWIDPTRRNQLFIIFFFAWFFIFMVFFLQNMRIRYIIPALPPLVILNVFGIRNIIKVKNKLVTGFVVILIIILVGMNFHYLYTRLNAIKPWLYLGSYETREQFLERLVGSYRPIKWINTSVPHDAKMLFILIGHRGYYCERDYLLFPNFSVKILDEMMRNSEAEGLKKLFSSLGITHIFTNHYLVFKYLGYNYSKEEISKLRLNMNKISEQIYIKGSYSVLELQ